jgi:predicted dehydrogenase
VPGCLAIAALARQATEKKRCFLVDYQLPTQPASIEVAERVRSGALGRLGHILSYGFGGGLADPPGKAGTVGRLRNRAWYSDIVFGGDVVLYYDIHIVDGVIWVLRKRPVSACGRSRICRPDPHGDRTDCGEMVFEFDDGTLWTHIVHALNDNADMPSLSASLYGTVATAHIQYGGKVFVRGGPKHYVGEIGSIYSDGAVRNVAEFYTNVTEGHFDNPTAHRAVDGTLTGILGREAAAGRRYLTMEELLKENKKLHLDLTGFKV